MARRIINGDIRLDTCLRRHQDKPPDFEFAMFHMDPKVIRGDITGLIEGYMSRVGLLSLHHIRKKEYKLFSVSFLKQLNAPDWILCQTRMFVRAARVLGQNFLTRFVVKLEDGAVGVLNDGYSFVVFPDGDTEKVFDYVTSVETTFGANPEAIYEELRELLVPPNPEIVRYFIWQATEENDVITETFALAKNISQKVTVVRTPTQVRLVSRT
jgi:hypothetical protein